MRKCDRDLTITREDQNLPSHPLSAVSVNWLAKSVEGVLKGPLKLLAEPSKLLSAAQNVGVVTSRDYVELAAPKNGGRLSFVVARHYDSGWATEFAW